MSLVQPDEILPEPNASIAGRAANEGVPVLAIARILREPSDKVYDTLAQLRDRGTIIEVPKADWPPAAKVADRVPVIARTLTDDDILFGLRKTFILTNLEGAFLLMLLKHERADKGKLHNIVETQRFARSQRPEDTETTDPKMVDVMICKLRKKLKEFDSTLVITTRWASGYYLEPPVKARIMSHITGAPDAPHPEGGQSRPAATH